MVADFRLWSTIRTAAQIAANRGASLAGTEAGLVGYWPLNEGAGALAFDYASSGSGAAGLFGNGDPARYPAWSPSGPPPAAVGRAGSTSPASYATRTNRRLVCGTP